jgi:hypothetical protein
MAFNHNSTQNSGEYSENNDYTMEDAYPEHYLTDNTSTTTNNNTPYSLNNPATWNALSIIVGESSQPNAAAQNQDNASGSGPGSGPGSGSGSGNDTQNSADSDIEMRDSESSSDEDADDSDLELLSHAKSYFPPYPMTSPLGSILIDRIRRSLCMPDGTSAEKVQQYLAANPSLIRHLAKRTVANPRHYVTDEHGTLYEPVLSRRGRHYAEYLLRDIEEIAWTDGLLIDALYIMTEPDRDTSIFTREELRKMFRGQVSTYAMLHRRAADPEYAKIRDAMRLETQLLRELRPYSLLRNVISASDEVPPAQK